MKLLMLAALCAHVLAQAPTENASVEIEVVVDDSAPSKIEPHWMLSVFQSRPPCESSVQKNQCTGNPREIALCLVNSGDELTAECKLEIFRGAIAHGDIEMLHLLSTKVPTAPEAPEEVAEPEDEPEQPTDAPTSSRPVHPIVARLRESCAVEFSNGMCPFVTKSRVCPRKLLKCLVENRDTLSPVCTAQTREELTAIVNTDHKWWVRQLCSLFAWILLILAMCMCCKCVAGLISRCCGTRSEPVLVEAVVLPSAPLSPEDEELEMVLKLSAAECTSKTNNKVVDGIPVVSAHDQV
jgi:hypothetical protein